MNARKLRNIGRSLLLAGAFVATTAPSVAEAAPRHRPVAMHTAYSSLPATPEHAATYRAKMHELLETLRSLTTVRGITGATASLDEAQNVLANISDDRMAEIFANAGLGIPDVSVAIGSAHEALQLVANPKPAAKEARDLTGSFGGGSDFPNPEALFCAGEPDDATLFALMLVKQATATILAAQFFVCESDILGENIAFLCIPMSIASIAADIAYEAATFCADQAEGTRAEATFKRTYYLHLQLGEAQVAIHDQVQAMWDMMRKTDIEHQLAANQETSFSALPAAHHGQLELVGQIANDACTNAANANVAVPPLAVTSLAAAQTAYNQGQWGTAFRKYQAAYKACLP